MQFWPTLEVFKKKSSSNLRKLFHPYDRNKQTAGSNLINRILVGILNALLLDIMKTFRKYGFDPDFYNAPIHPNNHSTEHKATLEAIATARSAAIEAVRVHYRAKGWRPVTDEDDCFQFNPPYQKHKTAAKNHMAADMRDSTTELDDEKIADIWNDSKVYDIEYDVEDRMKQELSEEQFKVYQYTNSNAMLREYLRYVFEV